MAREVELKVPTPPPFWEGRVGPLTVKYPGSGRGPLRPGGVAEVAGSEVERGPKVWRKWLGVRSKVGPKCGGSGWGERELGGGGSRSAAEPDVGLLAALFDRRGGGSGVRLR